MNKIISFSRFMQQSGIGFVRIITGFFIAYHGWEVFDNFKMNEYAAWDIFKNNTVAKSIVYSGKIAELVSGIFLLVGLCTRLVSLVIIATFLYISFIIGHGKIWYEDQHPFLFVLLGIIFFFSGAGNYSADKLLFKKTNLL